MILTRAIVHGYVALTVKYDCHQFKKPLVQNPAVSEWKFTQKMFLWGNCMFPFIFQSYTCLSKQHFFISVMMNKTKCKNSVKSDDNTASLVLCTFDTIITGREDSACKKRTRCEYERRNGLSGARDAQNVSRNNWANCLRSTTEPPFNYNHTYMFTQWKAVCSRKLKTARQWCDMIRCQ